MSGVMAVLRKELRDHLRDRRSLTSALLVPLLGPVMFAAMFSTIASWSRSDKPLELPVVGAQHAPNLVGFLERNNVRVKAAPPDHETQVRDGKLDVVLVIPEDYGKDWSAGASAGVQLVIDSSRNSARTAVRRTQRILSVYDSQVGALRLVARGISPRVATPVAVTELDLATPEKMAANALGMLPLFLLTSVFVGGMHLAIDATAGERERGSLEPLLINPVTRAAVVAGKWLATVLVTWAAVAVTIVGFLMAISYVPMQDLGVKVHLGPPEILMIVVVILPLSLLAAAVQMLLATYARSFKEAQTYNSLLMLIPMMPGFFITLHPLRSTMWMMLVPTLGQTLLVTDVLRGDALSVVPLTLAGLACVLAAAACLAATIRLFGQERIVFGR